jgi:glycine C-acetyltransferase
VTVLEMLEKNQSLIKKVHENSKYFRTEMEKLGFKLAGKDHPIIPVMLGDAKLASAMADAMLKEGVYVVGFSYPVVPQQQARIRTQISAGHDKHHLDKAIAAFAKIGKELSII